VNEEDSAPTRSSYLLDGRRVLVKDLLDYNLVAPGTHLTFRRPYLGAEYHATVIEGGRIELDDGRSFTTPSKAAAAAAGVKAMDGWHAWAVDGTGQQLAELRTELLDKVAGSTGTSEADPVASRYEFLREARERATSAPVEMSVRDLLERWDVSERSFDVEERIVADLENHGLTTSPDFRRVNLDSRVALRRIPQPADEASDADEPFGNPAETPSVTQVLEEGDIGLTLGNLPSAMGGLTSIKPQATFEEAMTKMALDDFSQLPVMANDRDLRGVVTWQSIAQTRLADPDAPLRDAIVHTLPERYDRPLVEVLGRLVEEGFVFVADDKRVISGIVTTTDVVLLYGSLALPFLMIGELDRRLRRVVSRLPFDQVCKVCDPTGSRGLQNPDDLTMGDYERALQNQDIWQALDWPLDRVVFAKRLGELRKVRNDIAHFNPDSNQQDVVPKIRNLLNVLRRHDD
jgi:CBS domain-containing protein